jgi:hypothetical protein
MTQKNIEHLAEKGNFKVKQRKNKQGDIDIYCKYVPNNPF